MKEELYDPLKDRQDWLGKVICMEEKQLRNAPEGRLKVVNRNDNTFYYLRTKENPVTGQYLRRNQLALAAAIAQRDLGYQTLKAARAEYEARDQLFLALPEICAEDVFSQQNIGRQKLVAPIVKPKEVLLREWEEDTYEKKGFVEGEKVFYTAKGERVRSKSEVLIADTFLRLGIPYHYEYPLRIKERLLHPDFKLLQLRTGKTWIWEHLGMMDNPVYAASAIERVIFYMLNGYISGKNLIISCETFRCPLNAEQVLALIREYLG